MIIYIFNNFLQDKAGFSKRCRREVELLSQHNDVHIVCRRESTFESNYFKTKYKNVPVDYFKPVLSNNKNHADYKFTGFTELIRNVDLFFAFASILMKVLWKNRNAKQRQLFVIVSPLTVPLISIFLGKLFSAKPTIVEFHDLEPEMASHLKNLTKNSLVMKIEYFLEKVICTSFQTIIVTSNTQAEKLIRRTKIKDKKVLFIPNSLHTEDSTVINEKSLRNLQQQYNLKNSFIITYISSYSFSYTVSGALKLIEGFNNLVDRIPKIKFLIVGDGDSLKILKSAVERLELSNYIVFTGRIEEISEVLSISDVCIIPWEQDVLSEVILPSKLFDYMSAKKTIIVPGFGEFKHTLQHKKNAFLYKSLDELIEYIIMIKENKKLAHTLGENLSKEYKQLYKPEIYEKKLTKLFMQ